MGEPGDENERWFIVVIQEGPDSPVRFSALSHRRNAPGEPFGGPWGLLTEDEAARLAEAWKADPRQTPATVHIAEVFRYERDPGWPEEYA